MGKALGLKIALVAGIVIIAGSYSEVSAMQFSSTDYTIDTAVLNNVGGDSTSTDYQLTDSGGEAAIGNGASGSYMIPAGYVAQLPSIINVKTEPSGLVGFYPLNEGSGTATYDASATGSNGLSTGGATWTAGEIGQALSFSGSQYLDVGNPSQHQSSVISLEAWVKTSTTPGSNSTIVGKSGAWAIDLTPTGSAIYNYSTSSTVCADNTNLANGSWHHIVATIQSGTTNGTVLYIDGVQKQTCTETIANQTSNTTIGGTATGSDLNGVVDQVKLFNRVLSSQEVTAEYSAQISGSQTGLTLQTITPGISNQSPFMIIIRTTAGGYNLSINEDHDLQNGSNTIPPISGTIASPVTWVEGTTNGLGFTLTGTNATPISASWSSGTAYAAIPTTATTFYTRTGTQSSKDIVNVQLRADVATTQVAGGYTNNMIITGTTNP